jgi:hypothetical protein
MSELKEMVNNDKKVHFKFYRDGQLWYSTECGFEFPVPISDIGNATFLCEDRAMLFMRYIRKHLALIEEAKAQGA